MGGGWGFVGEGGGCWACDVRFCIWLGRGGASRGAGGRNSVMGFVFKKKESQKSEFSANVTRETPILG